MGAAAAPESNAIPRRRFQILKSVNPVGPLQLSNVHDDGLELPIRHIDSRHRSEPPVMRRDSQPHGSPYRRITMMGRLVDTVNERWSILAAAGIRPVTSCTALIEGPSAQRRGAAELGNAHIKGKLVSGLAMGGKERRHSYQEEQRHGARDENSILPVGR